LAGKSSQLFFKVVLASLGMLGAPHAFAQIKTEMRVFSDSFISPTFEATQTTNYNFVGAELKSEPFSESALKVDVSAGLAIGAPLLNYLNIPELYVETRQSETATLYLGRKKMLWSELDAHWDLGVWEPLFKWNPLAPERQGLTGFFWQVDRPLYTVVLFASLLYIPDQGPSFEIEHGEFVKGNPWFRRPPETIRIWDEATAIEYGFERPNETQVVLQKSFGAKVSYGDPQALRMQLSYAYKPINALAVGYQGNLDLAQLKGNVQLQPQVYYHSVTGADLSYKFNRTRVGVSGIWERPTQDDAFESDWTRPIYSDAFLLSPFLEVDWGRWSFNLQRLDIFGGKVTEEGELASADRAPLMARYPFRQANQVSVISNWNFSKVRRLLAKVSYTVPDNDSFQLIRFNARWRLSGLWSVISEAQVVKAGKYATAADQNEIAQFENNDRFMIGAGYVF
jgi:hypothetical protein